MTIVEQDGTTIARDGDREIGPFYFNVVCWGAEFRDYLLTLLVPSLLAPGNIPALENRAESRFLIATTDEDWAALQDEPMFRRLCEVIEPLHVPMPAPQPGMSGHEKMLLMSKGHRQITNTIFEARANGVFLTPDLVLSDGTCIRLQELARDGYDVVLCAALRFEQEGCLAGLRAAGFLRVRRTDGVTGAAIDGDRARQSAWRDGSLRVGCGLLRGRAGRCILVG